MSSSHSAASLHLNMARVLGSAALAVFGQFAVDAPGAHFGRSDQITSLGVVFVAGILLLALIALLLFPRRRVLGRVLALVQMALVVASFVPLLGADPIVAGALVVWHVYLFGSLVFVPRGGREPIALGKAIQGEAEELWLARHGAALRHLLAVSVILAIAALGYRLGDRRVAQLICLLTGGGAILPALPFLWMRAKSKSILPLLFGALVLVAIALARHPTPALSFLALAQALLLADLVLRTRLVTDLVELFARQPAFPVVLSFVLLIAVGTLALSLPAASATGESIKPVDAFFTATSATCVTGLIVLDTPRDFSSFGLVTILSLIQLGGLNIMVLSAFAAMIVGRRLGLRGEGALGGALDVHSGRSARKLVSFIVASTLAVEVIGGLVLFGLYLRHGYDALRAAWFALFHAVSAFCNAGFSLHSDSLQGFQHDALFLVSVALLVTLGGLGFPVLASIWRLRGPQGKRGELVQVRVVLLASAVLTLGGAMAYAFLEWSSTLGGMSALDRCVNALFQSVTLRTAGFNSVGFDALQPSTMLLMLALMFIGASPGGTGGGIKTTTVVVMLGSVLAVLGRRERVVLFGFRIPLETVYRSAAIAVTAGLMAFAGMFALLATQAQELGVLVFESISAFGTVGLSLGATPELDGFGKLLVAALMFAGRVGPLTLALLLGRTLASRLSYPEARIMVG